MITFIISLIITSILAFILGLFKKNSLFDTTKWTQEDYSAGICSRSDVGEYKKSGFEGLQWKYIAKLGFCLIFLLLLCFNLPLGIQRIDAGNVGLKVDRIGNDKGIPVAQPCKGWVLYNTWSTDVIEYSIRQFHVEYGSFNVTAKGGTLIPVKPSFNVYLKPEKAVDVYIHLLKGADLETLKDTWLANATTLALRNATNRFTPDSIFNYSTNYQMAVKEELMHQIQQYFSIDNQLNPGQSPPESMKGILQAKANAVQAAQQAELDRQTADAQAYTKVAQARGDSAAVVIAAAGEAEAIKLKTREVSPTYVEYTKWLNANPDVPRVPSTVLGSNTSVLYSK